MLPSLLEEILKEIEIFDITEAEFKIGFPIGPQIITKKLFENEP